jgi:hypothetical protein
MAGRKRAGKWTIIAIGLFIVAAISRIGLLLGAPGSQAWGAKGGIMLLAVLR